MDSSEFDSSTSYDMEKKYRCPVDDCKFAFVKHSKLVYHLRKHTGERPFACDVQGCTKTYTNPSHLRRHKLMTHDENKKKIACTSHGCYLEFYNMSNMKRHFAHFHDPNKKSPYVCKECNEGFTKKRKLQRHMFTHTGVLEYECEVCKLRFSGKWGLSKHKRTHTVYTCECDESFERWSALLKHKREMHQPVTKCDECGKVLKSKVTLARHKKEVHITPEEIEVYTCPYEDCKRTYIYKKNLTSHINFIHKNVAKSKIPCPVENCGAMLSKMQNLKKHLDVHKNGVKRKAVRAVRKDAGLSRKSTAGVLSGVGLPENVNKRLINGENVDVNILQGEKERGI